MVYCRISVVIIGPLPGWGRISGHGIWISNCLKCSWWFWCKANLKSTGLHVLEFIHRACLEIQTVKNLPAVRETWVQSLVWEDPLEKGMATHLSFLAWRIPRTEQPVGLLSIGLQRIGHDWATNAFTFFHPLSWRLGAVSSGSKVLSVKWS